MKNILKPLTGLLLILLLSCTKDGGSQVAATLKFAQNPLLVGCDAGVYDCGLVTDASWKAGTDASWVTVLNTEGTASEDIRIRVSSNNEDSDRSGTITVSAGNLSKKLTIHQYGNEVAGFVSPSSLDFSTYGETRTVSVTSSGEWDVTDVQGDWFEIEIKGSSVVVTSGVNYSGKTLTGSFTVSLKDGSRSAKIPLTQTFENTKFLASTEYGRRFVYASNGYVKSVSSDSSEWLTDGVHSFEMTCTWQDSFADETEPLQRKLYLFEVDMTKATIVATLPDDNDANVTNATQKMTAQIAALQTSRPEITVYGGTNGDFFYGTSTPITLQGIMWRGGKCLKDTFDTSVNTAFAVLSDGSAVCLTQSEYPQYVDRISEAVGGRQNLLEKGAKVYFSDKTLNPRTAAGVSEDGHTAYLLVVDGRETLYGTGSHGASYDALARILLAAGAHEGINLDGGGSSSYVVRNAGGTFSLHNHPGNPSQIERAVLNGLAIVK